MNRKDAIRIIRESTGMPYAQIAKIVDETDPSLLENFAWAKRFLVDPIESDPAIGPIIDDIRKQAFELVKQERGEEKVWPPVVDDLAQRILMIEYGIDWRTPQQMNPHVLFQYATKHNRYCD